MAVKIRPDPMQATKSGSLAAVLPVAPKLLALLLTPSQRAQTLEPIPLPLLNSRPLGPQTLKDTAALNASSLDSKTLTEAA